MVATGWSKLKGCFAGLALAINTLTIFSLMIPFMVLKLLVPVGPMRKLWDAVLNGLASAWISINVAWMQVVGRTRWQIQGLEGLKPQGWYLVSCNHQSWADIMVLQRVFNRRIPLLKFFIKHELIYVPLMGLAWWALDFPFMKRRGGASAQQDLAAARKSCEKFRHIPTSVISFLEGTRYSPAKHKQQNSPYAHLLKPKVGGLGMALETMGELFDGLLDVTIVYPEGVPTFMDLLTGHMHAVIVDVRVLPIPPQMLVNSQGRSADRANLQAWVQDMWQAKDATITRHLAQATLVRR